jgi:hypothetical protein
MWTLVKEYWERVFLFSIAFVFLALCLRFFLKSEIAGATAAFVMFFLCLIYANVSRFKRFKGLGFEAELWEDKQKEAADLIERLKSIVQVYTNEIVMMKVMAGRWGGGSVWPDRWALYEELVGQHDTLGQKIDFLPLREKVYRVMVFDAVASLFSPVQQALAKTKQEAHKLTTAEFGNPIKDLDGWNKRAKELGELKAEVGDLFEISKKQNVARYVLDVVEQFSESARTKFGLAVDLPKEEMENLRRIDKLFKAGDLMIDPELVKWADRDK